MSQPTPNPGTTTNVVGIAANVATTVTQRVTNTRLLQAANLKNLLLGIGLFLLVVFGGYKLVVVIVSSFMPDNPLLAAMIKAVIGCGIAAVISGFIWRRAGNEWRAFLTQQPARGILIAFLLAIIYGGLLWLIYGAGAEWLVTKNGVSYRHAWMIATVLGLPLIVVFWLLFQTGTGLPGDWKMVNKGVGMLQSLALIFFGWWYYEVPNQFFDHSKGTPLFWVTEDGRDIFWSEGYHPETGEKLRKGTAEDAKKFRKEPWPKEIVKAAEMYVQDIELPSLSPAAYTTPAPVPDPVDQAKLRPGALVYYVGSQGAWIPAPRGVNVEWRGRANVCPDLPGPYGPKWSYAIFSSGTGGQTKDYLFVQPIDGIANGIAEVVVVP